MVKKIFIFFLCFLSLTKELKAVTKVANITLAGTYSFGTASLWLPSGVPTPGDIAIININLTLSTTNLTVTINNGLNLDNAINKGSLIINNNTNLSTNPLYQNISVKTILNGNLTASNTTQDGISINNNGTAYFSVFLTSLVNASNITNTNSINSGSLIVGFGTNAIVNDMTLKNFSSNTMLIGGSMHPSVSTNSNIQILGNLKLESLGGKLTQFTNPFQTTVSGNVILGSGSASEGNCRIGKAIYSAAIDQTYNLNGDLILNPGAQIYSGYTVFNFNKAGIQKITNNTDIGAAQPEFEKIKIGITNATTLTFDTLGINPFAYLVNSLANVGMEIGQNATLDLPRNYATGVNFSFNVLTDAFSMARCDLSMKANSRLRIGGSKTDIGSLSLGVFGSNFPNIRDNDPNPTFRGLYILNPTSTIEYYGNCTIAQTIHSGVPYAILQITNPGGIGVCKASKFISNPTKVKRFEAEINTELIIGSALDISN